jgi:formylglycine-generating enzyme required for sulfatase activity
MGSPPWEPDRIAGHEKPHRRVIGRSFALATKPVTVAQWQEFLKDRPDFRSELGKRYSPDPAGPVINVRWHLAAAYCNWLSEKEGIPKDQWCYPEKIGEGMKPHPDYLRRAGYRLPSEAEWEYACRAGAASSRYYGSSEELLRRYAVYQADAQNRAWPVGQKRPNDLGLFDMHGNVWTWCNDLADFYPGNRVEDREDLLEVPNAANRVLRGGAFDSAAPIVRSSLRFIAEPGFSLFTIGLRVARTVR